MLRFSNLPLLKQQQYCAFGLLLRSSTTTSNNYNSIQLLSSPAAATAAYQRGVGIFKSTPIYLFQTRQAQVQAQLHNEQQQDHELQNHQQVLSPFLEQVLAAIPQQQQEATTVVSNNNTTAASSSSSSPVSATLSFASGYPIPPAVCTIMLAHPKIVARNFKSNVYFTEAHLRMIGGVTVKDGEEPIEIICPPGVTQKRVLVLYNAEQTNQPDYQAPEQGTRLKKPGEMEKNKNKQVNKSLKKGEKNYRSAIYKEKIREYYSNKKNDNNHNNNNNNGSAASGNSEKEEVAVSENNNTKNDDEIFFSPQFVGGVLPSNNCYSQKTFPRSVWPTLCSLATQHGWTSPYWYTRNGMRTACLRPKIDVSCDGNRKMLPVVIRTQVHHYDKNTKNRVASFIFQTVWNGDQLECADDDFVEHDEDYNSNSDDAGRLALQEIEDMKCENHLSCSSASSTTAAAAAAGATASSNSSSLDENDLRLMNILRSFDTDEDGCIVSEEYDKAQEALEDLMLA